MDSKEREELSQNLGRLADGDRTAFRSVFEAVHPIVEKFTRRALPSADAEDAAQQTLLKVFSRASDYERGRDALSWIFGIAAFECMTLRKKILRRRESGDQLLVDMSGDYRSPEENLIERDLKEAAFQALGTLNPTDVETITAAIGEAERPPIPGPTFRKRVERALVRLRETWKEKHDG